MYQDFKILNERGLKIYLSSLSDITVKHKKYSLRFKLLTETITNVLVSPLVNPIPMNMLTGMYTVIFLEDMFKNKVSISSTKLYQNIRGRISIDKTVKKKNIVKTYRPSNKLLKIVLNLLDGFGLIHIIYSRGRYGIVLTELGNVVRNLLINNSKEVNRLPKVEKNTLILVPGLLFPTKAKLVYYLMHSAGRMSMDWYKLLKTKLIRNELTGYEKIAFEILKELELVNYGVVKGYITQTQLILNTLESINKYPGYKYVKNLMNKFAIRKSSVLNWPEKKIEEVTVGVELENLIERLVSQLKANEEKIENQLFILNGFL